MLVESTGCLVGESWFYFVVLERSWESFDACKEWFSYYLRLNDILVTVSKRPLFNVCFSHVRIQKNRAIFVCAHELSPNRPLVGFSSCS